MSNNINWITNAVKEHENRHGIVFGDSLKNRTVVVAVIKEISPNHTAAKVVTVDGGDTLTAAIWQHPNYWNVVGHLRVMDTVLCSVQNDVFDCNVMFRIHEKNMAFSDFDCYKNNDTNSWGTMSA